MKSKEKKPGWGGSRPNSGRKSERPVDRKKAFYLFADQIEHVTPDLVREAVDEKLKRDEK